MLVGLIYAAAHFQRNTGYKLKVQWHVLHLKCVCVCVLLYVSFLFVKPLPASLLPLINHRCWVSVSEESLPAVKQSESANCQDTGVNTHPHSPVGSHWCARAPVCLYNSASLWHTDSQWNPLSRNRPRPPLFSRPRLLSQRLKPDRHQTTWQSFLSPDHIELWLLYSAVGGWTLPLLLIPKNYVSLIVLM